MNDRHDNPSPEDDDPSTNRTPSDEPSAYLPPPPREPIPPGHVPPPPAYTPPPNWSKGARAAYHAGPYDPLVSGDYSGWWQRGIFLLRTLWKPMALVQLAGNGPLVVLGGLAAVPVTYNGLSDQQWLDDPAVVLPVVIPVVLIAILVTLIVQLATVEIVAQHVTGRPVSVGAALLTGLRRLPAFIGWGIPAGLLIALGSIFCLLPGIYVAAVMVTLPVIILAERGRVIGRAFHLFHADFGASAARIATLFGVQLALGVAEGVVGIIAGLDPSGVTSIAVSVAFAIGTGVFLAPFLLTTYADLRARYEPFTTAQLAT
ncbi:hypothetical protein [Paractinoplanes atraurantiacus]|uniref:Membrane domain of glycerophosphoryl diester phosphodiesterase n=1 Tax=Paractinoplanes atraurantiacus TaxID=1036182 RepID=A0A285H3S4_9ACTN|nr:hypothetical protein [Actinoplanes atraurantiacus]SNY29396.1 hypothetical protein SAMN05421748_103243 [Actinoplanes atraurantiacus]